MSPPSGRPRPWGPGQPAQGTALAGNATALFYTTDEAQEGRDAFLEKRPQDYRKYPWHY